MHDLLGLEGGRFFRQAVPAFGHQRIEALHQLLDLLLVLLERRVGHFHFAAGRLVADALLFLVNEQLLATPDRPARGAELSHQAFTHFRAEFARVRQIVRLILKHGFGRARIDHDLAAGLVDRVLHVLLPLLFQGGALVDCLHRGGAVGRGNFAVALKVQIARFRDRSIRRFAGRRGSVAAFLAMAPLIARAAMSLGLRLRASPASLSALSTLPPLSASPAK